MPARVNGVHGELLHWARQQQQFTMRWIHQHGGPSPAYQSEVENGCKAQVQSTQLAKWISLLNVTEAFVRGEIPSHDRAPDACRGLASDIAAVVTSAPKDSWRRLSEQQRVREILRLISHESQRLPRVVLAWVLGIELCTLDALLIGEHPVLQRHLRAVCDLTLIPDTFFLHGEMGVEMYLLEGYLAAVRLANKEGIAPDELLSLVTSVSNMLRSRSNVAPNAESCHSDRVTAFLSKSCSL
jgi:hypothetical protein